MATQQGQMSVEELQTLVVNALEDMKGVDLRVMDVREMTTVTDVMVVVSGNSARHVRSLAEELVTQVKAAGIQPLGVEGEDQGEWVLVDLADVVVHVMRPQVREFYNIEKLWSVADEARGAGGGAPPQP